MLRQLRKPVWLLLSFILMAAVEKSVSLAAKSALNTTPLPDQLWLIILKKLPALQLLRFATVSKFCNQLVTDEELWQDLCMRELSREETFPPPASWRAAFQKAALLWRNWRKGAFKVQYIKTGGTSFFCLLGDRIVYKTGYYLQCSNLRTGIVVWRSDITLDPKLRCLQVDPYSERILCVTKAENVSVYDSNGALHHSMHADGQIVQATMSNNLLFLLLKFKATKRCRLDVWDVQHRLVLRSFAPAYRSRFCVGSDALFIGESSALRMWTLPHLQPALSVSTEPVRSHKFMVTNGTHIFRVLKLGTEAYELQVIDAQRRSLAWRLSSTYPIRAMLADAWRLVVAFKDYVRVWDLRSQSLLLHLSKDVVQERSELQLPSLKLVEAKANWTSVFSATCIALQQSRLLVKFPSVPHIVLFDFSGAKAPAGAAEPAPVLVAEDDAEEPSDVTAMTLFGDRLSSRASELANDTLNLDEFA